MIEPITRNTATDIALFERSVAECAARTALCAHTLVLPLPPSLNNQYVDRIVECVDSTGKKYLTVRRFKSRALLQFEEDAGKIIAYEYRIRPHAPWTSKDVLVGYRALVVVPTWSSDSYNRMKPAIDTIAPFFGFNDNRVVGEHIYKTVARPPRLIICIYVLEPASTLAPIQKRERRRKVLPV